MKTRFSHVIIDALRDDRRVELERADEGGLQVVIDGVGLLDTDHGFAAESFDYPVDDRDLTDDGQSLVDDLVANRTE